MQSPGVRNKLNKKSRMIEGNEKYWQTYNEVIFGNQMEILFKMKNWKKFNLIKEINVI